MAEFLEDESSEKVIYVQEDVFVHTTQGASTFYDNIVRGKISVVVKREVTYVTWNPVSDLSIEDDIDDPVEYGIITTKELETKPKNALSQIQFDVKQIHSIRRSDPRLAWSYVVFILKDKTSHPALHFHNGGINEMISCLQRFIWLTRSAVNHKLYIVQQREAVMESNLNQFELFSDNPSDRVSKFINSTYYGTLNGFSKVTQYVLETIGHHDLYDKRPEPFISENSESGEEYEFLHSEEPDFLDTVIPVARGMSLDLEKWCAFIEDDGKLKDVKRLKEKIFHGGIHQDIRREVWKFLLGIYPFESTYDDRIRIRAEKVQMYETMMLQWKTITPAQEKRFTEFSQKKILVEKDAIRTDPKLRFYAGENNENVKKLINILMTYCMYNFDLGYVQGMSDLLSPILQLMEDEVDSFWCFVGLMEIEQGNFEMTQVLMKMQLEKLTDLIKYLYPNFFSYLKQHDSDNLYFCFRWILISFKRDFINNDLMTLWEALWCQSITPHFKLFICLAILEREKDLMMKNNYTFNDILKHINDLAYNIDLDYILSRAESICLQMQKADNLPNNLRDLFFFLQERILAIRF